MKSVDVAVLGSGGYAGQELVGTLRQHPGIAEVHTPTRDELPDFEGSEVVFSALPHGKSAQEVARFHRLGSTVIDLSGDLRLPTAGAYEQWYGQPHPAPELLPVPYGLPEFNRQAITDRRTDIVAMPGCYPTATALGLLPPVQAGLLDPHDFTVVDALSGVSGAGKEPSETTHFMNISGNATSYNTGRVHRHVGEMEYVLDGLKIFFSPTIIPVERGLLVKATARLSFGTPPQRVAQAFEDAYDSEPFVKVLPEGQLPDIKQTAHTDECHIGFVATRKIVQVGVSIDNLRKGAGAGQAVQVFNLLQGFSETTGLTPKADWQPAAGSSA